MPYDIRLKENFKLFISGPSRCGKTFFISNLILNIDSFSKEPPEQIIFIFSVWQWKYDEMHHCFKSLISVLGCQLRGYKSCELKKSFI